MENNLELGKADWEEVKKISEGSIKDARKVAEIHLAILKLANGKLKDF